IEIPISGGTLVIALKYENGAALNRPSPFIVVTKAIGRGTTTPIMNRYIAAGDIVVGSMITDGLELGALVAESATRRGAGNGPAAPCAGPPWFRRRSGAGSS